MHRTSAVPLDIDRLGTLDYLTVDEAAQVMRVGRSTVYRLVREGELPLLKIGRRSVITRQAVDGFMTATAGRGRRALLRA